MDTIIYPEETVRREPPVNLNSEHSHLFSHEFEKTFKEIRSEKYGKTTILPNGAVIKTLILHNLFFFENIPAKGLIRVKSVVKLYLMTILEWIKIRKKTKIQNALFLTNFYSDNFFHWMCDVLPKLELLKESDISLKDYTLVVPHSCDNPYTRFTLKRYGIPYKIMEKNEMIKADKLLHIPVLSPTGNFRPELMQKIRSGFSVHRSAESGEKRRIYISRKEAPKRKLINEEEILPILKKHNFNIVIMENLSFENQIRSVLHAEVLLSMHGAGLTHMLWLEEGAKVIEIREKNDNINNVFYSLASALNLNYYYLLSDKTNDLSTQKTDFKVDPVQFEKFLEGIISNQ